MNENVLRKVKGMLVDALETMGDYVYHLEILPETRLVSYRGIFMLVEIDLVDEKDYERVGNGSFRSQFFSKSIGRYGAKWVIRHEVAIQYLEAAFEQQAEFIIRLNDDIIKLHSTKTKRSGRK